MNAIVEGERTVLGIDEAPDLERRFGGLRRLYGDAAYLQIRDAHVVVVGVGGVGSWAAEALARSGVGALTLIDLDHVSESNINRQVQAVGATVGQAKVIALRERILDIHPGCDVQTVEEFVEEGNWPALLPARGVDAVIDACDQGRAKAVLAAWALEPTSPPLVVVGAAGGKREPHGVRVDDLEAVTHDPMLASLRQRLRKHHGAPKTGRIGVVCVYSREAVQAPIESCDLGEAGAADSGASSEVPDARADSTLNCHGYGSSVTVTATFGMVAASVAIESLLAFRARAGTAAKL